MTYSIVAWDPNSPSGPEWGVAVTSRFLAVGGIVPWAQAGAGAIATQAMANVGFGPQGLILLEGGLDASEVLQQLVAKDPDREHRQIGIIASDGSVATFTGRECIDWAGGRVGDGYCCQGNVLAGPRVIEETSRAFEGTKGELAHRLIVALEAGDAVGGDRRGRQSAVLVIAREGGSYGAGTDRAVDLRVDDHPTPLTELGRLYGLHQFYFPRPENLRFVGIDEALAEELGRRLRILGYEANPSSGYSADLSAALFRYMGMENLEERWSDDGRIEQEVLKHLRRATS